MNPSMRDAIKRSAAIPSVPQVVTRFLEVIQDPNFEYEDVVRTLSADAGTVSEILRMANSAFFGVARKVTSLKQALTLLGPKRTRSLVLARFLVESVERAQHRLVDTAYFWRRSLVSAVIAARLAEEVRSVSRDEAFLSALLADIGVAILADVAPDAYAPLAQRYAPAGLPFTLEEEEAAVGAHHAEVSAMVLAAWSLPEHICDAVRMGHGDGKASLQSAGLAVVIEAADRIARLLCAEADPELLVDDCRTAMGLVEADLGLLESILPQVESDVTELASTLKIQVFAGTSCRALLSVLQEYSRDAESCVHS